MLALTSPTSGGRSVEVVPSLTQATEFFVKFKGNNVFTSLTALLNLFEYRDRRRQNFMKTRTYVRTLYHMFHSR
jgi:hypothetical protein